MPVVNALKTNIFSLSKMLSSVEITHETKYSKITKIISDILVQLKCFKTFAKRISITDKDGTHKHIH